LESRDGDSYFRHSDERWSLMFRGLVEFNEENGHLKLPEGCKFKGHNLYKWVRRQRGFYKNTVNGLQPSLSQDRIDRLAAVGLKLGSNERNPGIQLSLSQDRALKFESNERNPGVQPSLSVEKRWSRMLQGLVEFNAMTGHFKVLKAYEYQGCSLYDWVRRQDELFRRSQNKRLSASSQDRIDRLAAIDFPFVKDEASRHRLDSDGRWSLMFKGLMVFKKMTGHLRVPKGCEYLGQSLYTWVDKQKIQFRNTMAGRTPSLSPDRIARLTEIGFLFATDNIVVGHRRTLLDNPGRLPRSTSRR
jgi:hypothetical protein